MKFNLIAAAALVAASVSAQAAPVLVPVTDLDPTATTVDFSAFEGLITGNTVVAPGITFTGSSDAEVGALARDLGDNGLWSFVRGGFVASGSSNSITFTFDSLQASVGAFVSHFGGMNTTVAVSINGADGQNLETFFNTFTASQGMDSYDEGAHLGFSRGVADIKSITFSGTGVVVDDLTAAVPEPTTYAMLLAGLALVGAAARRRRQA